MHRPAVTTLAGTYVKAQGSTKLIGGPGNTTELHPLADVPSEEVRRNMAGRVSRLTLQ
jgi:hypothetical protein